MSAPLLATKTYIPTTRPKRVSRRQILKRLDAGLDGKLSLVSAPAGFGKTTLLGEWVNKLIVDSSGIKVGWVLLDEDDNDLVRFFAYLIAALNSNEDGIGDGILVMVQNPPTLGVSARSQVQTALTVLINRIAQLPHQFILVLDDYHTIVSQSIHDAMSFLLDHLPGNMHIVIASRADPPLHLARLRGRGEITELRLADLRFTQAEVAEFLTQTFSLNLTQNQISALAERTEGWVTGLRLALISMKNYEHNEDINTFIKDFIGSDRYILDYLVEEVLEWQQNFIQRFLLHTSVLDRLSGSLCDAVLTNGDPTFPNLDPPVISSRDIL